MAPEGLTRCYLCDEPIDPLDLTCTVHEPDCDRDAWDDGWVCYCPTLYAHRRCCTECRPSVIPGQVSLLEDVPVASTSGLPKMRTRQP